MTTTRAFEVRFPLRDYLPRRNSSRTITEPRRQVPVLTECDVAVFGGGPAGVCAAAAAARAGRHVVLVERYGFLGGMATAAGVNCWHTLLGTDQQTQVIGGLPEELVGALRRRGAAYNTNGPAGTGSWVICSETAKLAFDDLAIGSGVKLLLHTSLADVVREGTRITAAIIEGKSGREAVVANAFIDCTGDADLVRRSGVGTQIGNAQGACQAPSLCFRLAAREPDALPLAAVQAALFAAPMDYNGARYPAFLWGHEGVWDEREQMLAGVRVLDVNGAHSLDLTRAEVEGRYQLRWLLAGLTKLRGWGKSHLVAIATQIGVRETHRIIADHQLTREEVLHGAAFDDAIAQGTYPIDIHDPGGPGITFEYLDGTARRVQGDRSAETWRWDGQPTDAPLRDTLCYQIPYRSIIPRQLSNVLVAGRCIGASHEAAGAVRVMVNCMQFGQAAGMAAAMTGDDGDVRGVDVSRLQARLRREGVPLRLP